MFGFLAVLFLYSLLFFGAVRPLETYVVGITAVVGFGVLIVTDVIRRQRLSVFFLLFSGIAFLIMATAGVKPAIGLFAASWSWEAARRKPNSVLKFFYFLFFLGLLEALLGLFQYFVSPGWMPGYHNAFSISAGTLINRNHFAGFLEMTIAVSLGLAYAAAHLDEGIARSYSILLGAALMGLAVMFSLSRTGIISLVLTLMFITIAIWTRVSQKRLAITLATVFFGLLAGGALWIGMENIFARYEELLQQDEMLSAGRLDLSRDTLKMIVANPLGIGAGKYQDVFRQYQTFHTESLFDHAHNDYLEITAEWGILGSLVFWVSIVLILISAARAFAHHPIPARRGGLLACAGALFAILVHSTTDFNLQIPSNAMLFFSFVGIALALTTRKGGVKAVR